MHCVARPYRPLGEQIRKRGRHDFNAAEIDPVATRKGRVEAVRLVRIVQIRVADEDDFAGQIAHSFSARSAPVRQHRLVWEGLNPCPGSVEVEIAIFGAGVESRERPKQSSVSWIGTGIILLTENPCDPLPKSGVLLKSPAQSLHQLLDIGGLSQFAGVRRQLFDPRRSRLLKDGQPLVVYVQGT